MTGTKTLAMGAAIAALMAAAGAANAQAASNFYLKGFGGFTLPNSDNTDVTIEATGVRQGYSLDFDNGYTLGFAGGYVVSPSLAVELEYAYRDANITSSIGGDLSSNAIMVNAIYRFNPFGANGEWMPYAGGGIGGANVDLASDKFGDFQKTGSFAYQLIGGVAYAVSPEISLMGEARWFATESASISHAGFDASDVGIGTFDILFGASYNF